MKRIYLTAITALVLLATPLARAWTYSDTDTLLIFRASGFSDVEFNLGNISQFTNVPSGTTIPVTGWNVNLVTGTFGSDLTGVSVIVAATTSPYATSKISWVSGKVAGGTITETPTSSSWQSKFWSSINGVGTKPILNTVPPASANAYIINPASADTQGASYDYIVTGANQRLAQIAFLGGNASFNVEGLVPSSFGLWQIAPGTAAKYVGTFTVTDSGELTFTAGPFTTVTPPAIVGITRSGNISTVSFTTIGGGNYWLTYTNTLADSGSSTNWPVVSGPVIGDGSNHSLNHTNDTDTAGFYRVSRTP